MSKYGEINHISGHIFIDEAQLYIGTIKIALVMITLYPFKLNHLFNYIMATTSFALKNDVTIF